MNKCEHNQDDGFKVNLKGRGMQYVLPLNDISVRAMARAIIGGRRAFVNLTELQVIIMPYVEGVISVVDEFGQIRIEEHVLNDAQRKEHADIFAYMSHNLWTLENTVTFNPDDAEDYDTQKCMVECMENLLICLDPYDERIKVFDDILQSSQSPSQEIVYNLHRLNMLHLWERHYLVWKIADINATLRKYGIFMFALPNRFNSSNDAGDQADTPE